MILKNTVNTVIIGAGDIARKRHIPAIMQAPNGTLVGFYNRHYDRTRELAEQYGGCAYQSYQEIWDDKDVDAVLISSPPESHAEIAIAAMKAGKHVLLEKPMTLSVKEAEEIADVANRYDRKLMMLHIQRYYDAHQKAKELLAAGAIGDLLTIRSVLGNNDRSILAGVPKAGWQDALYNVGIHRIDLMRWLVGSEAESVYCHRSHFLVKPLSEQEERKADDHAVSIIQYENGVVGTLTASRISFHGEDRSTTLIGTKGAIVTFSGGHDLVLTKLDGQKEIYDFPSAHAQGVWELTDIHIRFFDSILQDTEPEITAFDGVASVRIAAAMEKADFEKRLVHMCEI